jgi:uncharacterized membrane protein YphA (DoxX/SURF4 family)
VSSVRAVPVVRILTGLLFVAEGYGKIAGDFVRGGFRAQASEMARTAFPFWQRILLSTVVPHAQAVGWLFAIAELAVGVALVFGLLTRAACAVGVALMISILLSGANPKPGAPWHGWITAGLTPKLALLLFALLFAVDAGRVWGFDARLLRRKAIRRGQRPGV